MSGDDQPAKGKARQGAASADYEVGYGKPPRGSRFQPGVSGNPKGRPKRRATSQESFQKVLNLPVVISEGGRKRKISTQEALFRRMRRGALEGDARDRRAYLEAMERYAPDEVQTIAELFAEDARLLRELRLAAGEHDATSTGAAPTHGAGDGE